MNEKTKSPHWVDVHVGKRIRQRRGHMRLSQENLAETTGVKFPQIQKYETGANRVSASRLWEIATALDVTVRYFFEGLDENDGGQQSEEATFRYSKEAEEMINAYFNLPETHRTKMLELAQLMGTSQAAASVMPMQDVKAQDCRKEDC